MARIEFVQADGSATTIAATAGISLMEAARMNGVEGIVADCGGVCACATCHVQIDPDWIAALPPRTGPEEEMLEFAKDVTPASRLACQIPVTDALDGMTVRVPESQY